MNRSLTPALLIAVAVGLSACGREAEQKDAAAPAAANADAGSDTARSVAPAAAPQGPAAPESPEAAFDKGAFSGTFANGPIRLELHADGTYMLDAREESGRGSWTHEAKDGLIRLDPGSKDAQDRVFRVQGDDQLVPVADPGLAPFPVLARLATS